ncbi:MATE family efflux transporter [Litchfieldia salsa]|uniref:Putative efflux protein, MATE family n=1 Tax=Litchfieldia salsa TaxID=930152 RepID=A0A1H0UML2_9BACI|nr:MATE family efflux transporter [Litchfieldia salsa]SDP67188.1 putative efflux protein, MATE family [Litchfieldia salsa]
MKVTTTTKKITLFALTWPIFIELLLHMLMGNADTLMLSQYSDNSVAAVGVANQIFYVFIVMFGFIAAGTSVLVAQYFGAKQFKEAAEISVVSIAANFVFSLFLSGIVILFSVNMLKFMDLPTELLDEANSYLKLVGGTAFLQALIMTIGAIIRSYGYTKDSMYVTIGMNLINVIGNYLFIFGPLGIPVLGVFGVALSTVISKAIGLIAITYLLFKRIDKELPFKRLFQLPISHLKNLLRIGVPSAGENLSYSGSQMVITIFITMIGTEALTTKVYAHNLMMLISLFSISIAQGTQIIIGQMIGARELSKAYITCLKSLNKALIISFIFAVIFWLSSDPLFSIFTNNLSIIELGTTLLLLAIILEPGRAFNLIIINALRATGDVKFPVYMGILSMWGIAVPISYFLGIYLGYGLIGIWIAFILDEWLRGIIMLWRWKTKAWEKKAFIHSQPKHEVAAST